jgi:hypothetical protein
MLGMMMKAVGLQQLHGPADRLSVEERRRFAHMLCEIAEHDEPLDDVVERDWGWGVRPFVWRGYAVDTIARATRYEPIERRNLRDWYYRNQAEQQLLIQELQGGATPSLSHASPQRPYPPCVDGESG